MAAESGAGPQEMMEGESPPGLLRNLRGSGWRGAAGCSSAAAGRCGCQLLAGGGACGASAVVQPPCVRPQGHCPGGQALSGSRAQGAGVCYRGMA